MVGRGVDLDWATEPLLVMVQWKDARLGLRYFHTSLLTIQKFVMLVAMQESFTSKLPVWACQPGRAVVHQISRRPELAFGHVRSRLLYHSAPTVVHSWSNSWSGNFY